MSKAWPVFLLAVAVSVPATAAAHKGGTIGGGHMASGGHQTSGGHSIHTVPFHQGNPVGNHPQGIHQKNPVWNHPQGIHPGNMGGVTPRGNGNVHASSVTPFGLTFGNNRPGNASTPKSNGNSITSQPKTYGHSVTSQPKTTTPQSTKMNTGVSVKTTGLGTPNHKSPSTTKNFGEHREKKTIEDINHALKQMVKTEKIMEKQIEKQVADLRHFKGDPKDINRALKQLVKAEKFVEKQIEKQVADLRHFKGDLKDKHHPEDKHHPQSPNNKSQSPNNKSQSPNNNSQSPNNSTPIMAVNGGTGSVPGSSTATNPVNGTTNTDPLNSTTNTNPLNGTTNLTGSNTDEVPVETTNKGSGSVTINAEEEMVTEPKTTDIGAEDGLYNVRGGVDHLKGMEKQLYTQPKGLTNKSGRKAEAGVVSMQQRQGQAMAKQESPVEQPENPTPPTAPAPQQTVSQEKGPSLPVVPSLVGLLTFGATVVVGWKKFR